MKVITDRQQNILDYITQFMRKEGMSPTILEIGEHFKIRPASAFAHIRALQKKGYLNRSSKARSLSIMQDDSKASRKPKTITVPVIGRVSAGATQLTEELVESHIQIDPKLLPPQTDSTKLFGLKVHGESMRDMGILDGDLIIAKQTDAPSIGDIVIAMVDGETTVKSLYMANQNWELRPANPDFKSRFVPLGELKVQGVVVALQRII